MEHSATVRLELDSRPEAVTLVRATLSAIARSLGLRGEVLNDVKTAVSEACNNVVVHAYQGLPGPVRVEVDAASEGMTVAVRDYGSGMQNPAAREERMGVGLAVISALATRTELLTPSDGGTEVRMWFATAASEMNLLGQWDDARRDGQLPRELSREPVERALEISGDVVVTVAPVALMAPVLGRLARALAAGARFSFDRFSDVYLVADTIGAHAQRAAATDYISFSVRAASKRLELSIGPFAQGSGAQLQRRAASKGHDSPLPLLADEINVQRAGESETLRVVLRDRGVVAGESNALGP